MSAPTSKAETGPRPLTRELVDHARRIDIGTLPADIVALAQLCVLDYIGVAAAGTPAPEVSLIREHARAEGQGSTGLIAHSETLSPANAALVNGTAAHALDYDDVHMALPGHVSAPVLSALLPLAEARGHSGADLIAAFVAGFEVACRTALFVAPSHYNRGFHASATLGAIGAAAACARLLQLSAHQTACAIGIAATQAGGLKAMFGTMCKPLHVGLAARNGLDAALLAERGFESRVDALECDQGFGSALSDSRRFDEALAEPAAGFHIRENLFKFHASCYGTHAVIEAARTLRMRHDESPQAIRSAVARVGRLNERMCNIPAPRTGLEGKFSLRLMIAFAFLGIDTARLDVFNDDLVNQPSVTELRDKIDITFDDAMTMTQATLDVTFSDGSTQIAQSDVGIPERDLSILRPRLIQKFEALAEPIFGRDRTAMIKHAIDGLPDLKRVSELTDLLRL